MVASQGSELLGKVLVETTFSVSQANKIRANFHVRNYRRALRDDPSVHAGLCFTRRRSCDAIRSEWSDYWKGRYHLFYIFRKWRHYWGHSSASICSLAKSSHCIGCCTRRSGPWDFSGNAFIDRDGLPTIMYHGVGLGNCLRNPMIHCSRNGPSPIAIHRYPSRQKVALNIRYTLLGSARMDGRRQVLCDFWRSENSLNRGDS